MKRCIGLVLLLATAGCMGSASVYYQDRNGGVLALHDDRDKAMKDAHRQMAAHCGGQGYEIVKQETVVVGKEAYANTDHNYGEQQDSQRHEQTAGGVHTEETHEQGGFTQTTHTEGEQDDYDGYEAGSQTTTEEGSGGSSQSTTTAVGETHQQQNTTVSGGDSTRSVSGVRDVTEVRVTYRCTGAAPVAAPVAAPAQ